MNLIYFIQLLFNYSYFSLKINTLETKKLKFLSEKIGYFKRKCSEIFVFLGMMKTFASKPTIFFEGMEGFSVL